jgi:hypothetical protein
MNTKTKYWLLQIFATKIGWLAISFLTIIIFGALSNVYSWAGDVAMIAGLYPIVLILILIIFGWVINPIRDYIASKKNK